MPAINRLDTSTFTSLLSEPSAVIVDARPIAAFNGWRLRGEARGGHIPSARCLPVTRSEERRVGEEWGCGGTAYGQRRRERRGSRGIRNARRGGKRCRGESG